MFADRLEIKNPGGLFGAVTVENLDEEQSTRNARLMRMMEDTHLVENRGSGIRSMVQALGEANLEPPRFNDHRVSFQVTFHNHTLLNPETLTWLNQFSYLSINDRQRKALAFLRLHSQITNPEYRRLNHVDSLTAGSELRGLTQMGLIEQQGAGRWTSYTLCIEDDASPKRVVKSEEDQILDFVQSHKSITNLECRNILKVDIIRAHYLLRKLSQAGHLSPVNSGRWRYYVLKR
jgi:ATP-dependent DNA helicase RecG